MPRVRCYWGNYDGGLLAGTSSSPLTPEIGAYWAAGPQCAPAVRYRNRSDSVHGPG